MKKAYMRAQPWGENGAYKSKAMFREVFRKFLGVQQL